MSMTEVASTLATMMRHYDAGDSEQFLACFAPDIVMRTHLPDGTVITANGIGEVATIAAGTLKANPSLLKHFVFTPAIEVLSEDRVDARYHQLYVRVGDDPAIAGAGDYHDRLVRRDGAWKLVERDLYFLAPPPKR